MHRLRLAAGKDGMIIEGGTTEVGRSTVVGTTLHTSFPNCHTAKIKVLVMGGFLL